VPMGGNVIYDYTLPDPIIVSYGRLFGRAWDGETARKLALYMDELTALLGRSRTQTRQHLRVLRLAKLIDWTTDGSGRMFITFLFSPVIVTSGKPDSQAITSPENRKTGLTTGSESGKPDSFERESGKPDLTATALIKAVVVNQEAAEKNKDALRQAGIRGRIIETLAALPHITPDYIQAHAQKASDEKRPLGILIARLRDADPLPVTISTDIDQTSWEQLAADTREIEADDAQTAELETWAAVGPDEAPEDRIWSDVQASLAGSLQPRIYQEWIAPLQIVSLQSDRAVLAVRQQVDFYRMRLNRAVELAFIAVTGAEPWNIQFVLEGEINHG
jgi:hypothetical protein